MIIRKFFGAIIIMVGGLTLLISGGCTLFGGFIIIVEIVTLNFRGISSILPLGAFTLFSLLVGYFISRLGLSLLDDKSDVEENSSDGNVKNDVEDFGENN